MLVQRFHFVPIGSLTEHISPIGYVDFVLKMLVQRFHIVPIGSLNLNCIINVCICGPEQCNKSTFRYEQLKPPVLSSLTDSTEMVQHGGLTTKGHLVLLAVAILSFPLCLFLCISSFSRRQWRPAKGFMQLNVYSGLINKHMFTNGYPNLWL